MKKSVSLIVFAVSLLAIVFVAIFGTKPQGIVPKIYMESIQIKPSDNSQYDETQNKMVLVYDEEQEVYYDGNYYMPYIFSTIVLPENATDRSFVYYFDESYKPFLDFPLDNEGAKFRGAFMVKKNVHKKFQAVKINCKPLDGGKAPVATLTVVIDYRNVYEPMTSKVEGSLV